MTKPPRPENEPFDVALLGGKTDDGGGVRVLRLRPDGASIGEIRPLQEGRPIQGEVVQLKPRSDAPWVCDVDVAVPATAALPAPSASPPPSASTPAPRASSPSTTPPERHGPAQVATPAYRSNWDRIFGAKKSGGELNLSAISDHHRSRFQPSSFTDSTVIACRAALKRQSCSADDRSPRSERRLPRGAAPLFEQKPLQHPEYPDIARSNLSPLIAQYAVTPTRPTVTSGEAAAKRRHDICRLHEPCRKARAALSSRHDASHRLASALPIPAPGL